MADNGVIGTDWSKFTNLPAHNKFNVAILMMATLIILGSGKLFGHFWDFYGWLIGLSLGAGAVALVISQVILKLTPVLQATITSQVVSGPVAPPSVRR